MVHFVKVTDIVPNAFESVLIYMPNKHPLPRVHEGYYANEKWYYNQERLEDGEVTHWAPMPLGPEKE